MPNRLNWVLTSAKKWRVYLYLFNWVFIIAKNGVFYAKLVWDKNEMLCDTGMQKIDGTHTPCCVRIYVTESFIEQRK